MLPVDARARKKVGSRKCGNGEIGGDGSGKVEKVVVGVGKWCWCWWV